MCLLDIFLTFGAPATLQSDNGREFITELTTLWPELKLVTGRPRHPQSQGVCVGVCVCQRVCMCVCEGGTQLL